MQVARSYAPLKLIDFFFADNGYSLESRRLEDDDFGLSFEMRVISKEKGSMATCLRLLSLI